MRECPHTSILHETELPMFLSSNMGSSRPSRSLKSLFAASINRIPSLPRTVKLIEGRGFQPSCVVSHWYAVCSTMQRLRRVYKGPKVAG